MNEYIKYITEHWRYCDKTKVSTIILEKVMNVENTIDLSKTVYEICKDNPEVIDIMKELGFENIANPAMLNTARRFMTIPKGAAMKNISLDKVKEVFNSKGYEIKE